VDSVEVQHPKEVSFQILLHWPPLTARGRLNGEQEAKEVTLCGAGLERGAISLKETTKLTQTLLSSSPQGEQ
jgi:hypothetical protein